jgi:hypothetical protein
MLTAWWPTTATQSTMHHYAFENSEACAIVMRLPGNSSLNFSEVFLSEQRRFDCHIANLIDRRSIPDWIILFQFPFNALLYMTFQNSSQFSDLTGPGAESHLFNRNRLNKSRPNIALSQTSPEIIQKSAYSQWYCIQMSFLGGRTVNTLPPLFFLPQEDDMNDPKPPDQHEISGRIR